MLEYDQMLYEDESVDCMQEELSLFDLVCNSRWFIKTSIILFFNKIDLLTKKTPPLTTGGLLPRLCRW
ncbi:G protein alpha-subunit [Laccaria bicolor S238N-H82]|uniref:G protein alpha-subunit n=1 Tax=Laccaria bicolor (strain S238N-H82 / ATCC MYA-4686) TaxID=486041 RepID=B0DNI2_LACBS|nr:G protein alpha-subunit [Laccaria bicolor S238N-H82]EDR03876.1 G protein alpha-subunit [Laccaria bicolor S238N-H82]|eukprot:XP_001885444.1 G protein alpha-subunit [Laccaria bicolor S238N-H82]